jgi:hypothetical protein
VKRGDKSRVATRHERSTRKINNLEGNPNSISARWPNERIHPREEGEGERSKIGISAKLPRDWIAGVTGYAVKEDTRSE